MVGAEEVGGAGAGGTGQQKATKSEVVEDAEGSSSAGAYATGGGVPMVEVRAGRQVGLECVVTKARPPAGVAWYRSGVKISQGGWVALVLVS